MRVIIDKLEDILLSKYSELLEAMRNNTEIKAHLAH